MTALFVVCAAVGATILVLQFLLSLIGLGGEHDVGHDVGGMDHDVATDDLHVDVAHDAGGGANSETHPSGAPHATHGSLSLARAVSVRTVTAALAFFGLSGMAANAADYSPPATLAIAVAAGLAAMYAVYYIFDFMRSLRAEGTAHIQRALGKEATVYLRIPGNRQGRGKIQINLQNRTMEYLAVTAGGPIPSGATVIVTEVLGADLVQVEALPRSLTNDIPQHQPELQQKGLR